ncbi:MAG: integrin alpha, partial [Candidatus Methylomirabilis sp.]|nr:integrin alpha [Deltaproteobacteria bacterium]
AREGEFAGDRFGETIAPAGDIQDNGGADLAVGAPGYDGGTGRVYVLKGEDGVPFRTFDGDEYGDEFGRSLFGGLNITGGREDAGYEAELLIGAPQYFTSRRGKVYVYTPRFTLGDQAGRLAVITGESADARIGLSVAAIGDLDCDMRSGIVVGGQGYAALHRGGGREPITAEDALQDILDGVDPEGEDVGAIVAKLRETAGL